MQHNWRLSVQSQQWNDGTMKQVNPKTTLMTVSLLFTFNKFLTFSNVFIVAFEQVNVGLEFPT